MNYRLTIAAAVAVILASVSEFSLIGGAAWFAQGALAVIVVALAGTATRLGPVPAAVTATVLAALAGAPMLIAHSPFWKIAWAALILACGASASGLRPLRAAASLVTYLASLLLLLNVLHAASRSVLAVVPTPRSLHHLTVLASAGGGAARYSPPVAGRPGVLLLAAASIGLAAIVVDVLAVRLHRPAIAGLPLLVVYMAPIATTANVKGLAGAIAFALAAVGYMALLSSDGRNRLRGWGRIVTVWHYSGEDERLAGADMGALAATGRRIGLAAVCAAVIAPLLFPGLTIRQIFGGHGGGGGHTAEVGLPDPVAQLHGLLSKASPRQVLTYRTTGDSAQNYFQVYVLNYDPGASDWGLIHPSGGSQVSGKPLQAAPGLAAGTTVTPVRTTVTIPKVDGFAWPIYFLPVPYWPERIAVSGSWREAPGTSMIYSDGGSTAGLRYTVTSGDVEPTADELGAGQRLPAAIERSYLGFSSPVTGQLTAIARQVTKGKATPFAQAVALERWFLSSRFSYSLESSLPNTPAGLLAFLTTSRTGYCQQYAFAMAVLARLLGIPSRVVVGYTAGRQRADGSWVVTTADAHAWPELYFAGAGWLRFEPTPGGAGGQDTAVEPAYVSAATSRGGSGTQAPATGPAGSSKAGKSSAGNLRNHLREAGRGSGPAIGVRLAGSSDTWVWYIVAGLLLALAAGPGITRLIGRRRVWRSADGDTGLAAAAWRELCADLDDYGQRRRPSESPRAVARRVRAISGLDPAAGQAVERIATIVERARYAPAPAAAGPARADVSMVRKALARCSSRSVRWRARLLPPSVVHPLRSGFRQAAGLLTGWSPATSEN
ncbi:MAG: transglutaminase TgpA family protein [Streptosporangiaceae bacterium]